VFALLIVGSHAMDRSPDLAITVLGALVLVTTVVSGLDYVITYAQKSMAASRDRRQPQT
jgi:hypothetical protein